MQRPCGNIIFVREEEGIVVKQFSPNKRFQLKIDREKQFYQQLREGINNAIPVPSYKEINESNIVLFFIRPDNHSVNIEFGSLMIETIAKLHVQFWCSSALLDPMFDVRQILIDDNKKDFEVLNNNSSKLPISLYTKLHNFENRTDVTPSQNFTLVHGDYKIDNVIFHDKMLFVIDWDVYHKNCGALDVVFLCLRWPHQGDIVELFRRYYSTISDKLMESRSIVYSEEEFRKDIQWVLIDYCYYFVNSATNLVKDPVRLKMIHANYEFMIDVFL